VDKMQSNLRRMWLFSKKYKKEQFILMLPFTFAIICSAITPFYIRTFIDSLSKSVDLRYIVEIAMKILLLQTSAALGWWMGEYMIQTLQRVSMVNLQGELFEHILKVSVPFYWKNPTGVLMSKINSDAEMVGRIAPVWMVSLLTQFLNMGIGLIVLLKLNYLLTFITILILPLYYFSAKYFSKKIQKASYKERKTYSVSTELLREGIEGAVTIKCYNKESFFIALYRSRLKNWLRNIKAVLFNQILSINILGYVVNISPLIILGIGGIMASRGITTIGTAIAFFTFVGRLFNPIRNVADTYNMLQQTYPMADRLLEILETPTERSGPQNVHDVNVKFENVSMSINGKEILKDIDLEINKGEILAIVGSSGAGKSSIANLMLGLLHPTKGKVLIGGVDIEELDLKELRKRILIVRGGDYLFNMSIRENIVLGDEFTEKELSEVIEIAKIDEFAKNMDVVIGERGISLSDGQKQRIAIARAVIRKPEVLILDEATSALDSENEKEIFDNIRSYLKNSSIILISHRLSTIKKADKIILLKNGHIADTGSHEDLLKKSKTYKELIDEQLIL